MINMLKIREENLKKVLSLLLSLVIFGCDGELSTGLDRIIYFAKNLQVGLFDNLTYDFGGDPALDSF